MMLSLLLFLSLNLSVTQTAPQLLELRKNVDILIIGNSVTISVPNPEKGWYGNWGMAATAADKDYVSVLKSKLSAEDKYRKVCIDRKNLSFWEHDFTYDLKQVADISRSRYDIVIISLGDNVDEKAAQFPVYETELKKLVSHFKCPKSKVIITGTIWNSPAKDSIHKKIADENGYSYISLLEMQQKDANFATGKFSDPQISAHPSDEGMMEIAELLFKTIVSIY